eukprot:CAMPEP_0179113558 /NCGR_PEP_ID=MMETSP0796-20121207/53134_1 /TAXON_ID=73915 /ORGANISM="Pyrodinium bahamense, Strain pbaha01" /LENGTH=151 /DNA_ID=CAMNT_0020811757 /DNA_START=118 /DNA_END=573 /DNA_ORIENTATION=+
MTETCVSTPLRRGARPIAALIARERILSVPTHSSASAVYPRKFTFTGAAVRRGFVETARTCAAYQTPSSACACSRMPGASTEGSAATGAAALARLRARVAALAPGARGRALDLMLSNPSQASCVASYPRYRTLTGALARRTLLETWTTSAG